MSLRLGSSPRTGVAARATGNWNRTAFAVVVVLFVVFSTFALFVFAAPSAAGPSGAAGSTHPAVSPDLPTTHSDLVVAAGQTFTIQAGGSNVYAPPYYQGGNITVLAGGTLVVQNVDLTFVQFIGSNGTLGQRLSHIYTFTNYGTVDVTNSNITTDTAVLNAYVKLNLVDYGSMNLVDSELQFPGWVQVSGTSAELTLNDSQITANPNVPSMIEPFSILGDTSFAASLSVTNGASLFLFNSTLADTYADNTLLDGTPGPAPLSADNVALPGSASNQLSTPTDPANLTLDWLYYPHGVGAGFGVAGGNVLVTYTNTLTNASNYSVSVEYQQVTYAVAGVMHFLGSTTGGQAVLTLPPALIDAINAGGMLTYLNQTCSFGTSPCGIYLNFTLVGGPGPVTLSPAQVTLLPSLQYNVVASDGTVVGMNSALGLTFGAPPSSSNSKSTPYPWTSNLFYFDDSSNAYLLNDSITAGISGVYSQSALVPDATSVVSLYRTAEFNLTNLSAQVPGGPLIMGPVAGATADAYYAYNTDQLSNATATTLNDISGLGFNGLTGYLNFWDGTLGVGKYGVSNSLGKAYLLLASSQLDGATTLPDGNYLGAYHVAIHVPFVASATWVSYSVEPYPTGVAAGTTAYGTSDYITIQVPLPAPAVHFVVVNGPVPAGTALNLNNYYATSGVINITGFGDATVTIAATPVGSAIGGGSTVTIVIDPTVANGTFTIAWPSISGVLSPGTSYVFTAYATFKTANSGYYTIGTWSVPASTSATGFLFEKFLGLPLWLWIAIAAAAVVAILVVLLLFRRQAAGKLVECGECGELIPEDATVCPKCGAQFETDLVRCSRCSSTIPANSQFCPECGAQLLGKPGEGGSDPERQAYADFTEKFRAEGKKELGDNYTESAFWDWWKRQPTYVPFSQWKVQQNKGAPRAGMSAPPVGSETAPPAEGTPLKTEAVPSPAPGAPGSPAPGAGPGMTAPPLAATGPAPPGGLKPCPNCGKEIPPEYLVCPFCGAVTQ
ncbi:MAG: zinc ribbon domain-containing protein [Thermoplasmata archaeon]